MSRFEITIAEDTYRGGTWQQQAAYVIPGNQPDRLPMYPLAAELRQNSMCMRRILVPGEMHDAVNGCWRGNETSGESDPVNFSGISPGEEKIARAAVTTNQTPARRYSEYLDPSIKMEIAFESKGKGYEDCTYILR